MQMIAADLCPKTLPHASAERGNHDPTLKVCTAIVCTHCFAVCGHGKVHKLNPHLALKALSGDYQLEACTPFHLNFKCVILCSFGYSIACICVTVFLTSRTTSLLGDVSECISLNRSVLAE